MDFTLIQFSTTTCGPCKAAKKMIEEQVIPESENLLTEDGYRIIYLDKMEGDDSFYLPFVNHIGLRSVPTFIVLDENKKLVNIQGEKEDGEVFKVESFRARDLPTLIEIFFNPNREVEIENSDEEE